MPRIAPFDRPATYPDRRRSRTFGGPYHFNPGGPRGWWDPRRAGASLRHDVFVPDLAGWRRSRLPKVPDVAYCSVAPDWVCEVVSPSTASLGRTLKLRVYAWQQVGHAWLVDPAARTLEVLELNDGRWVILGVHVGVEVVRVAPFVGTDLELSSLWPE